MQQTIVSGDAPRLKPPGKRIAVAIALLVGAIVVGWTQRDNLGTPKLLTLHVNETLKPQEISLRQIVGKPEGAPDNFECVVVYEVRTIDPAMSFSEAFTLNFFEDGDGLEVIRVDKAGWARVEDSRPWFGKVSVRVKSTQPGVFALGRFR